MNRLLTVFLILFLIIGIGGCESGLIEDSLNENDIKLGDTEVIVLEGNIGEGFSEATVWLKLKNLGEAGIFKIQFLERGEITKETEPFEVGSKWEGTSSFKINITTHMTIAQSVRVLSRQKGEIQYYKTFEDTGLIYAIGKETPTDTTIEEIERLLKELEEDLIARKFNEVHRFFAEEFYLYDRGYYGEAYTALNKEDIPEVFYAIYPDNRYEEFGLPNEWSFEGDYYVIDDNKIQLYATRTIGWSRNSIIGESGSSRGLIFIKENDSWYIKYSGTQHGLVNDWLKKIES